MKEPMKKIKSFAAMLATGLSLGVGAEVVPFGIFNSGMVLQRGIPVSVWGKADAGEAVTVAFAGQSVSTTADAKGAWSVRLAAMDANATGRAMSITGKNTVTLDNILVGDVWLCAGQSNMAMQYYDDNQTIKPFVSEADNYPMIRSINGQKNVENFSAESPWVVAASNTMGKITLTGYFFARRLVNELEVPIGLVDTSIPGMGIEAFLGPAVSAYNRSIAPFGFKGAIWYQGESNCGDNEAYRFKMTQLVGEWREALAMPELPFFYVQLCAYGDSSFTQLREAQRMAMTMIPEPVGMACTIDIGDFGGLHPFNKYDVGERLAAWALNKTYGKTEVVVSGPLYKSIRTEGNQARLSFDFADGLKLGKKGGHIDFIEDPAPTMVDVVKKFKLAGADGVWHDADSVAFDGGDVLVSSASVASPTAVRYAYEKNPTGAFIYNSANLPMVPFRTDYDPDYFGEPPDWTPKTEVLVTLLSPLGCTGGLQTGVVAKAGYKLSGDFAATAVGVYTATATLEDGYQWSDHLKAQSRTVTWSIVEDLSSVGIQLWEDGPEWAMFNVGATVPEGCGNVCKFDAAADAVSGALGAQWRVPTEAELRQLSDSCNKAWMKLNGVEGCLFTHKSNGKSIFLPTAASSNGGAGARGSYWSSDAVNADYAYYLSVSSNAIQRSWTHRSSADAFVRAVRDAGGTDEPVTPPGGDGLAETFAFRNVYGSHMVLQREMPIRLAGTADAGKKLTVEIKDENGDVVNSAVVTADADGAWQATFPAKPAGGPYRVTLTGANGRVVALEDVLMGDVWLCAGQSNMDMPVWSRNGLEDANFREDNGDQIAAAANDPDLRLCNYNYHPQGMPWSKTPLDDLPFDGWGVNQYRTVWGAATDEATVSGFSATGYFFGRELRQKLKVPVGLFHCTRGATAISAWMSNSAHRKCDPAAEPPETLNNSMVHPFTAFPIKGVVWYQGENDFNDPVGYAKRLKCWLEGLREDWNQQLPCVIVQLARYIPASGGLHNLANPYTEEEISQRGYVCNSLGYAPMREVETEMMDTDSLCGVSVSVDLGSPYDIHPRNKKDFGPRIAAEAMRVAYGSTEVAHGPRFDGVRFENGKAIVSFKDLGSGLATKDGKAPQHCLVAGANLAFYPATAEIVGNTLVLSSSEVPEPKYVRYAWQDYCHNPNLVNKDGFPAYPFRTDGAGGVKTIESIPELGLELEAVTSLVYNGMLQTGVVDKVGYTLSGDFAAKDVGEYTAYAIPEFDFQWTKWSDGFEPWVQAFQPFPRPVKWSIVKSGGTDEPVTPPSGDGPMVKIDGTTGDNPWQSLTVNYTLNGIDANTDYKLVFGLSVGDTMKAVTNAAARLTDGAASKFLDTAAILGFATNTGSRVNVSVALIEIEKGIGGVQLWENGPYWAEWNAGATKPEEFGEVGRFDNTSNLVSRTFGAPWRVPTKDELQELADRCAYRSEVMEINNVTGRVFTSEYTSKSIFFPFAGCLHGESRDDIGVRACSWSSTAHSDTNYVYYLSIQRGAPENYPVHINYTGRFTGGASVRPVRDPTDPIVASDDYEIDLVSYTTANGFAEALAADTNRIDPDAAPAQGGDYVLALDNGDGSTDYVHVFLTAGEATFTTENDLTARVVAIGGGGGGGGPGTFAGYKYYGGGGGGAGALVEQFGLSLVAGTYGITIGAGGVGRGLWGEVGYGENGGMTSLASGETILLSAAGGGGGGSNLSAGNGRDGACGGGAGGHGADVEVAYAGGEAASGQDGGSAPVCDYCCGAGGGGMDGQGDDGSGKGSGDGGKGVVCDITGHLVYYAGGGAGGSVDKTRAGGVGGFGGGGSSFPGVEKIDGVKPGDGVGGLGGGGAGSSYPNNLGGNGGSGAVIIRYTVGGTGPRKAKVPTGKTLTYTGAEQTGVETQPGSTLSGDFKATNADEYTAIATLVDGYEWADGVTDAAREIKLSIAKATPTISGTLVMPGWKEGETASEPSGLATDFGEVVYAYYSDASCTTAIAKPTTAGAYYVRGEVAGTANWNAAVSAAKAFTITEAGGDEPIVPPSGDELAETFAFRNVYGSRMVLQREMPIRLAGTADAGKKLTVAMTDEKGVVVNSAVVTANADGTWQTTFPAKPAGGPYRVTLTGANGRVVALEDVLMGDVWLCSGQSNMNMPIWGNAPMYREADGDKIAAEANDAELRMFLYENVKFPASATPQAELINMYSQRIQDCWRAATNANSVAACSATGYFFGRELRQRLNVPIGLVCCSVGGTQIWKWMSDSARSRFVADGKTGLAGTQSTDPTLHNGQTHAFTAFAIKGVIWYQGESDAHQPVAYADLLKYWLAGLREEWNQPDLPCVVAQLARFEPYGPISERSAYTEEELSQRGYVYGLNNYAQMREVETEMMDSDPHCGVSVSVDLGTIADIHPHNKKDFGPRIAAEAMRVAYGSQEVTHGPRFESVRFENGKAIVSFKDLGSGLATKDGKAPQHCLVSGATLSFYPATAEIVGDTLVLSSPEVPDPKYVRYAWQNYCHNPNLVNAEGFPVYPFRTDGAHGESPKDYKPEIGLELEAVESLVYNGMLQTGVVDKVGYKLEGDFAATEIGNYKATVTLQTDFQWTKWSDGYPNLERKVEWSIVEPGGILKAKVPTGKTLTYTGAEQTGVEAQPGSTLSGDFKATNADEYTAIATLVDGYEWADGYEQATREIKWSIAKATPTISGTLVMADWEEGETASEPSGLTADFGEVVYAYYDDSGCTQAIAKPTTEGTYYVRGEVAASANWNAAVSAAKAFAISEAGGGGGDEPVVPPSGDEPTVTVDTVATGEPWSTITVEYTLGGLDAATKYALAFEVTAKGVTRGVTNAPAILTDGAATQVIDTVALFGSARSDANAKVRVALLAEGAASGGVQLWADGPYWAECNLGASSPEGCGDKMAFGSAAEAVKTELGDSWRLPTKAEAQGLIDNCNSEWTSVNGVNGRRLTSKFNGSSIFLPITDANLQAGFYWTADAHDVDGFAWSYSLRETGNIAVSWSTTPSKLGVRTVSDVPGGEGEVASGEQTLELVPSGDEPLLQAEVPTGKTLTYTGKVQVGVEALAGSSLSGTFSATDANDEYTATATLDVGYEWADGVTDSTREIKWSIVKATPVISGTLAMADWKEGETASEPSGLSSSFGAVTYAYYADQTCTQAIAKPTTEGTYYVRGEVAASANWNAAVSAAKAFTISKEGGDGPTVKITGIPSLNPWQALTVNYALGGIDADANYKVAFDVTIGEVTKGVTNAAAKLTDGAASKNIDTAALFGTAAKADCRVSVRVSLIGIDKVSGVQLWENGPYWAECNLGAETSEECGTIMTFEAAVAYEFDAPWRLPTQAEIKGLVDNCTVSWENRNGTNGCLFTSKSLSGSLFLPATGPAATSGNYWSSEVVSGVPTYGWYLLVRNTPAAAAAYALRTTAMNVRAVCHPGETAVAADERVVDLVNYTTVDGFADALAADVNRVESAPAQGGDYILKLDNGDGSTDYVHVFLTAGEATFTTPDDLTTRVLLVGGGGGGGGPGDISSALSAGVKGGGGGGAGALVSEFGYPLAAGTYGITVGAGGNGGGLWLTDVGEGRTGGASNLASDGKTLLSAAGGGGGGSRKGTGNGLNGGCGGGAGGHEAEIEATLVGGAGDPGKAGGSTAGGVLCFGAGGGGMGGAGEDGTSAKSGSGGNGVVNDITGHGVYYAGGGAGGIMDRSASAGIGGLGGGGCAILGQGGTGGTRGLGGGGAGSSVNNQYGAAGGSGVVIIRYTVGAPIPPEPGRTVTVTRGEGIADIATASGSVFADDAKSATVELAAGAETLELTLVASGDLVIPAYKLVTNSVTNVTVRTATYAVAGGEALTFLAMEAGEDETLGADETLSAIVAAIDDSDGETHAAAVAKVMAIASVGEGGKRMVEPRELAAWIADNRIASAELAASDYAVASVKLDTDKPITEEAAVAFSGIAANADTGIVLEFTLVLEGETDDALALTEGDARKEFVASCIQVTDDLAAGFDGTTIAPDRVEILDGGKVRIEPEAARGAGFCRIVIPKDPPQK